jgi:hypothetical protein
MERHVMHMGEMRTAYTILVSIPEKETTWEM